MKHSIFRPAAAARAAGFEPTVAPLRDQVSTTGKPIGITGNRAFCRTDCPGALDGAAATR